MDEFKYDKDEMENRELAFELSRLNVVLDAMLASIEWKNLKEKYHFEDSECPAVTRIIQSSVKVLDKNSAAYDYFFNNPLVKLAMISQTPKPESEGNSEFEKIPG